MNNTNNKKYDILPFILFLIFVYIPLSFSKYDMWDGVIIDYAYKIKNTLGIKTWFFESSWIFQYFQLETYFKLVAFFNLSYKFINDISILIFGIILIKEFKFICINLFKISEKNTLFVLCLIAIYPAWSTFLSSVLTFYFLCFVFGILSVRLLHSKKIVYNIISIFILIIVYNYSSLLIFLPSLSYLYDDKLSEERYFSKPSFRTFFIFSISILYYLIFKIIYPPSGMYIGYNVISFNNNVIPQMIKSIFGFATFLIIPLIFVFFLKSFSFKLKKQFIYLFILFIASVAPYILVGRHVNIINFWDWEYRHVYLLSFSICIFFGIFFDNKNSLKLKSLYSKIIILFSFVILLLCGFLIKLNRQIFEDDLSQLLKNENVVYTNTIIQIVGSNLPLPAFRTYEANHLFYRLNNSQTNWISITNKYSNDFDLSNKVLVDKKYQLGHVLNTNIKPNKHVLIKIKCTGYRNPLDILLNLCKLNKNKSIIIIK